MKVDANHPCQLANDLLPSLWVHFSLPEPANTDFSRCYAKWRGCKVWVFVQKSRCLSL